MGITTKILIHPWRVEDLRTESLVFEDSSTLGKQAEREIILGGGHTVSKIIMEFKMCGNKKNKMCGNMEASLEINVKIFPIFPNMENIHCCEHKEGRYRVSGIEVSVSKE